MLHKSWGKIGLLIGALVIAVAGGMLLFTAKTSHFPGVEASSQPSSQPSVHVDPRQASYGEIPGPADIPRPLPPGVDKSFGAVNAKELHQYVVDLAKIALDYRDKDPGNMWWGRIAGFPSGEAGMAYVAQKFKEFGLEVQTPLLNMGAQDWPRTWEVNVTGNGKTIKLVSANPTIDFTEHAPSMTGDENLEAVWVGLGQPVDFRGKDVRGKAVFIYSVATPGSLQQSAMWMHATVRAMQGGAKAIIIDLAIPGNWRYVSHMAYARGIKTPVFTIGDDDGKSVEALAAAGDFKAHVVWNVQHYPDMHETLVIGKLQGTGDENEVLEAHVDSYFQGASDDAAGTAVLMGVAKYFSELPKAQRRRTMYFIATPDHHGGDHGGQYLANNFQSVFAKTAAVMNVEHPAQEVPFWDNLEWGQMDTEPVLMPNNGVYPCWWGVWGSDKMINIVKDDFTLFGVPLRTREGGSSGELRAVQYKAPSFYLHAKQVYYHAENSTPNIILGEALKADVQAISKIYLDLNKLEIKDLKSTKPAPQGPLTD